MRVAYLVSRFPKLSETFIVDEISALARRGVQIDLYSLVRERESVSHPEAARMADQCRVTSLFSPALWLAQAVWLVREPRTLIQIWARVLREHRHAPRLLARAIAAVALASLYALRMERAGVAHVHAHWATHPALGAWVVHRLTGLSYSFTTHADDLFVHQTMLAEKARGAAFVVAISEYNRRFLAEWLAPASTRIEVVHCGVASDALHPHAEPAAPPFRIACVARLEAKKGHVELLDAIAELVRRGVDVRCDLVGDGPQRRALTERVRTLGLGERVTLHGAQPRERALACVSAAHAVALPSFVTATGRRDGIPVALMEAMALGRPVVATALSGIPELVVPERTGLLVPPGDRDALVAALSRLASDPALRRHLGAAARAHVAARFDIDRSSDRLRELFAAAIGTAPPYVAIEPFAASEVSG